MMKLMARQTYVGAFVENTHSEWEEVTETYGYFPSGRRAMVRFNDGYTVKTDRCEICYVFEK